MDKKVNYDLLSQQILALTEGIPHEIANLANVSALLWQTLPDINWAGFYKREGEDLILYPFQGKPACIRIPRGKGVCGTAAAEDQTQLVYNVHDFPGHIACDSASSSEIVIPLHKDGELWGVLDIDSPSVGRFTEEDRQGLELAARTLEQSVFH